MVFEIDEPVSLSDISAIIAESWPNAVLEVVSKNELLVYRELEDFESWKQYGRTDENADALLHVILDGCEVTIVYEPPQEEA